LVRHERNTIEEYTQEEKRLAMRKGCFIITGTSRGIGEALALALLRDGYGVTGIARRPSAMLQSYAGYKHRIVDLGDISGIEQVMASIVQDCYRTSAEAISLVNNAAIVEPLKSIANCRTDEISNSLNINLVAPIVCAAAFIRCTEHLDMRRKIVNITSGSGIHPFPDMSIYSAAKAGMNMFTRCVGMEQSTGVRPVEIIAVDPGMVETQMQQMARNKNNDFAMADYFDEAYRTGHLQSPDAIAQHIIRILHDVQEPGRVMRYTDC